MDAQTRKAMKQIFMGFYALSPSDQWAMLEHLNKYFGATPVPLIVAPLDEIASAVVVQ